jgi:hypothetical protein
MKKLRSGQLTIAALLYPASLGLALILGALLRLVANGGPFASSDHAELAAIVTYFYPRGLSSFYSAPPLTWHLLTNVHGMLPPLIGLISTTAVAITGVRVTEWWWNLPFAAAGVASIVVGARFATALAGRRAGAIAAILLAVLPIHAATSRASGLSHITLMGLCQLVTLWCFMRYYEQPTPPRARAASLALSITLLVELFFPVLLALLFAAGLLSVQAEGGLKGRIARARQLFAAREVMLGPLLVICATAIVMVAYSAGLVPQGGPFSRLFEGSDRQSGLYLGAFWSSGAFTAGAAGFALLFALGLLGLPALLRLERRAIPLLWAAAYLLPFLLFTRSNVAGYFLMGLMGLALNAALVIDSLWAWRTSTRVVAGLLAPALAIALALRALSMIFGVSTGGLVGEGIAQGAVHPDQGLKAAAWWIRSTTGRDDLVFADGQFEPYQLWYYLRRPVVAVTDAARPEEAYLALRRREERPALYVVPPAHEELLYTYVPERPPLLLVVTDRGAPILNVYGFGAEGAPLQLDASDSNHDFDRDFGGFAAMFSQPGNR